MYKLLPTLFITLLTSCFLCTACAAPSKKKTSSPAVKDVLFVAFDVETTGLSASKDRIVEIAAVKFKNGKMIDRKSWLVNPERSIPPYVSKVHGIKDEDVKDQPLFSAIYSEFETFIEGAVLVAHNAPFDIRFVKAELTRMEHAVPGNQVLDTLKLFRHWYPKLEKHKLKYVADHLKITDKGTFHRALADCEYLSLTFIAAVDQKAPGGTLQDLFDIQRNALTFAAKETSSSGPLAKK